MSKTQPAVELKAPDIQRWREVDGAHAGVHWVHV